MDADPKATGQAKCGDLDEVRDTFRSERDALRRESDALKSERDALRKERDAFRNELDQLKLDSVNLTKELELLQSRFQTVVASRDELHKEVNWFNQNVTGNEETIEDFD